MDVFTDIFSSINEIKAGSVVGIGGLMAAVVRLYKMVPGAPWPKEKHNWIVSVALFFGGLLTSVLTGALGFNAPWGEAVMTGLGVAVNAAGIHTVTSQLGAAVRKADAPGERPGFFSKMISLFAPKPKS